MRIIWQQWVDEATTFFALLYPESEKVLVCFGRDRATKQVRVSGSNGVDGAPLYMTEFSQSMLHQGLCTTADNLIWLSLSAKDPISGQASCLVYSATGDSLWSYSFPKAVCNHTVVDEQGHGWLVVGRNLLYRLNHIEQTVTLIAELPYTASAAAPLITAEAIVIPCTEPHLMFYHFARETVETRPLLDQEGWLNTTPVLSGSQLLTSSADGHIQAWAWPSGQPLWNKSVAGKAPLTSVAISDNRIIVGSRDGVYAFDVMTQEEVWRCGVTNGLVAPPVVRGKTVVWAGRDRTVRLCLAETGEEIGQFVATRRFEVAPIWVQDDRLAVVDRSGTLTLLQAPIVIPANGKSVSLDRAEKAITAEENRSWLEAAEIWGQLGRDRRQAIAFENHARQLEDLGRADAAAWRAAAELYASCEMIEEWATCCRHEARLRQWPILDVRIDSDGLVLHEWAQLDLTIHNSGFGDAYLVTVQTQNKTGQFEGSLINTLEIQYIRQDEVRRNRLDVRPLQSGETVPLRLTVYYEDARAVPHRLSQTLYLPVSNQLEQPLESVPAFDALAPKEDDGSSYHFMMEPDRETDTDNDQSIIAPEVDKLLSNRVQLRLFNICREAFRLADLKVICLALDLDAEDFPPTKQDLIFELITHVSRHGQIAAFLTACKMVNPSVGWDELI